jgi:hypothetical protein
MFLVHGKSTLLICKFFPPDNCSCWEPQKLITGTGLLQIAGSIQFFSLPSFGHTFSSLWGQSILRICHWKNGITESERGKFEIQQTILLESSSKVEASYFIGFISKTGY